MQSVSTRHQTRNGHVDFFMDGKGRPIKFRIQPGFSSVLRTRLEDGITSHGGLVISKIPIHGLVVVDPKSRAGRELVREWAWAERPARRFVSYAFLQQCFDAKQLLPLDEHALRQESFILAANGPGKTQPDLSRDAKDKLAFYLATISPDPTSQRRSSNKVYQRLIKNKHRYHLVGSHDWKTFRDHYCKNKKFYDRLISAIVDECGHNAKHRPIPRREFLIAKKADNGLRTSVVEVVIPIRRRPVVGNVDLATNKKVSFDSPLLIERKRKFANDITNVERKTEAPKILRTIDDMLNAPLPTIVKERKSARLPRKLAKAPTRRDADVSDVEVGRAVPGRSQADVWIDNNLKDDGSLNKENTPQVDARHNISGSQTLSRFQHSLSFYGMDLDDLRSAATLIAMNNNSDADLNDEENVAEILGISTASSKARTPSQAADPMFKERLTAMKASSHQASARCDAQDHEDPEPIAIRELALSTHFTREEVEQKLAGFSGDMDKTRDFFERCRQLVEDLFTNSSNAKASAAVTTTSGVQTETTRRLSYPASNTRSRKAARAAKEG